MRRHYTVTVKLIAPEGASKAIREAVVAALTMDDAVDAGEVDVLVTMHRAITVNRRGFAIAAPPLKRPKPRTNKAQRLRAEAKWDRMQTVELSVEWVPFNALADTLADEDIPCRRAHSPFKGHVGVEVPARMERRASAVLFGGKR